MSVKINETLGKTFPPTKTDIVYFEIKVFIAPLQLDE